jgi:hypothetical protein
MPHLAARASAADCLSDARAWCVAHRAVAAFDLHVIVVESAAGLLSSNRLLLLLLLLSSTASAAAAAGMSPCREQAAVMARVQGW